MGVVWIKALTVRTGHANVIGHVDRVLAMMDSGRARPQPARDEPHEARGRRRGLRRLRPPRGAEDRDGALMSARAPRRGAAPAALATGAPRSAAEPMRVGWKIGLNVPEVQQKLGLERSVVGNLTSATLLRPGASHSLAGTENPKVEPEIAIEVGAGRVDRGARRRDRGRGLRPPGGGRLRDRLHQHLPPRRGDRQLRARRLARRASPPCCRVDGEERESAPADKFDLPAIVALVDETLATAGREPGGGRPHHRRLAHHARGRAARTARVAGPRRARVRSRSTSPTEPQEDHDHHRPARRPLRARPFLRRRPPRAADRRRARGCRRRAHLRHAGPLHRPGDRPGGPRRRRGRGPRGARRARGAGGRLDAQDGAGQARRHAVRAGAPGGRALGRAGRAGGAGQRQAGEAGQGRGRPPGGRAPALLRGLADQDRGPDDSGLHPRHARVHAARAGRGVPGRSSRGTSRC